MVTKKFVFLFTIWITYYIFSPVECIYGDITSMAGDGKSSTSTLFIGSAWANISIGTYSEGSGTSATFGQPYSLTIDSSSNVYIADRINHRLRKLTYTTGIISTVAGNGVTSASTTIQRTNYVYAGDGAQATSTPLSYFQGVAVDMNGNIYIADTTFNKIRKVSSSGIITSVVNYKDGTSAGTSDGVATSSKVHFPRQLCVDSSASTTNPNIFISDTSGNRVRMLLTATNTLYTVAGNAGTSYNSGNYDNYESISVSINGPSGIVSDSSGYVYFAENPNGGRIRKLVPTYAWGSTSQLNCVATTAAPFCITISTICGTFATSAQGLVDNVYATASFVNRVEQITLDSSGNMYIADKGNNVIRKITWSTQIITSIVGGGTLSTYATVQATSTTLANPIGVAVNSAGYLYVTDATRMRLLMIDNVSNKPTGQPSRQPSRQPTSKPSSQPSSQPTMQPSRQPTSRPSSQPSSQPTMQPSRQPSSKPSSQPTSRPSSQPSRQPTSRPSSQPSSRPSSQPSQQPTSKPSSQPSRQPSSQPSSQPTSQPSTEAPTPFPTIPLPSSQPSSQPTSRPSSQPSQQPSSKPSSQPTSRPSSQPSRQPSSKPSSQPTSRPSSQPSSQPSFKPSSQPSSKPTMQPSSQPSSQPSNPTSQPSSKPSSQPSQNPTNPTSTPTSVPTDAIPYDSMYLALVPYSIAIAIGLVLSTIGAREHVYKNIDKKMAIVGKLVYQSAQLTLTQALDAVKGVGFRQEAPDKPTLIDLMQSVGFDKEKDSVSGGLPGETAVDMYNNEFLDTDDFLAKQMELVHVATDEQAHMDDAVDLTDWNNIKENLRDYVNNLFGHRGGVFSSERAWVKVLVEVLCNSTYYKLMFGHYNTVVEYYLYAYQMYTLFSFTFLFMTVFYNQQFEVVQYSICGAYNGNQGTCENQMYDFFGEWTMCYYDPSDSGCWPLYPDYNGRIILLVVFFSSAISSVFHFFLDLLFKVIMKGMVYSEEDPLYGNYSTRHIELHDAISYMPKTHSKFYYSNMFASFDEDNLKLISTYIDAMPHKNIKSFSDSWNMNFIEQNLTMMHGVSQYSKMLEPKIRSHAGFFILRKFVTDLINSLGYDMEMASVIYNAKIDGILSDLPLLDFRQKNVEFVFRSYSFYIAPIKLLSIACFILLGLLNLTALIVSCYMGYQRTSTWFYGYFICCLCFFGYDWLIYQPCIAIMNNYLIPSMAAFPVSMARDIITDSIDRFCVEEEANAVIFQRDLISSMCSQMIDDILIDVYSIHAKTTKVMCEEIVSKAMKKAVKIGKENRVKRKRRLEEELAASEQRQALEAAAVAAAQESSFHDLSHHLVNDILTEVAARLAAAEIASPDAIRSEAHNLAATLMSSMILKEVDIEVRKEIAEEDNVITHEYIASFIKDLLMKEVGVEAGREAREVIDLPLIRKGVTERLVKEVIDESVDFEVKRHSYVNELLLRAQVYIRQSEAVHEMSAPFIERVFKEAYFRHETITENITSLISKTLRKMASSRREAYTTEPDDSEVKMEHIDECSSPGRSARSEGESRGSSMKAPQIAPFPNLRSGPAGSSDEVPIDYSLICAESISLEVVAAITGSIVRGFMINKMVEEFLLVVSIDDQIEEIVNEVMSANLADIAADGVISNVLHHFVEEYIAYRINHSHDFGLDAYIAERGLAFTDPSKELSFPYFFFVSNVLARDSSVSGLPESRLVLFYKHCWSHAQHPSYVRNNTGSALSRLIVSYSLCAPSLQNTMFSVFLSGLFGGVVFITYISDTSSDVASIVVGALFPFLFLVFFAIAASMIAALSFFKFVDGTQTSIVVEEEQQQDLAIVTSGQEGVEYLEEFHVRGFNDEDMLEDGLDLFHRRTRDDDDDDDMSDGEDEAATTVAAPGLSELKGNTSWKALKVLAKVAGHTAVMEKKKNFAKVRTLSTIAHMAEEVDEKALESAHELAKQKLRKRLLTKSELNHKLSDFETAEANRDQKDEEKAAAYKKNLQNRLDLMKRMRKAKREAKREAEAAEAAKRNLESQLEELEIESGIATDPGHASGVLSPDPQMSLMGQMAAMLPSSPLKKKQAHDFTFRHDLLLAKHELPRSRPDAGPGSPTGKASSINSALSSPTVAQRIRSLPMALLSMKKPVSTQFDSPLKPAEKVLQKPVSQKAPEKASLASNKVVPVIFTEQRVQPAAAMEKTGATTSIHIAPDKTSGAAPIMASKNRMPETTPPITRKVTSKIAKNMTRRTSDQISDQGLDSSSTSSSNDESPPMQSTRATKRRSQKKADDKSKNQVVSATAHTQSLAQAKKEKVQAATVGAAHSAEAGAKKKAVSKIAQHQVSDAKRTIGALEGSGSSSSSSSDSEETV